MNDPGALGYRVGVVWIRNENEGQAGLMTALKAVAAARAALIGLVPRAKA
ncbi:hypothetical protein [Streptomyces sp. NPDC021096]